MESAPAVCLRHRGGTGGGGTQRACKDAGGGQGREAKEREAAQDRAAAKDDFTGITETLLIAQGRGERGCAYQDCDQGLARDLPGTDTGEAANAFSRASLSPSA